MNLSELIRPHDPVVAKLLASAGCHPGVPVGVRVRQLCAELRTWRFEPRLGPSASYDQAASAKSANCIDLSSILCASLRATGARQCYALLGSTTGSFPVSVHAWTLAHDDDTGGWLCVDPYDMQPEACDPQQLRHRLTVLAAWNEESAFITPAERDDFWTRLCRRDKE